MKILFSILLFFGCALVYGQDPTDIYLFDVETGEETIVLSNMRNITNHKGYDNQPFFHPTESIIYYSSFDDEGRSDIKSFNFKNNRARNITETQEREYSPTVTPDGKFLSCIIQRDDGAQDLGKYPIDGGEPVTLISDLIVGYHVWVDADRLLLFVLGDEAMTLHRYDLSSGEDEVLIDNIGRALHKIPEQEKMSFVHKESDDQWWIMGFDISNQSTSKILKTLPDREDLAWLPNGSLLMSDGKNLLINSDLKDGSWKQVDMGDAKLSGVTRIAVSGDGKHLAIVADE